MYSDIYLKGNEDFLKKLLRKKWIRPSRTYLGVSIAAVPIGIAFSCSCLQSPLGSYSRALCKFWLTFWLNSVECYKVTVHEGWSKFA